MFVRDETGLSGNETLTTRELTEICIECDGVAFVCLCLWGEGGRDKIWSLRLARQVVGKRSTTELHLSPAIVFDSSTSKAIPVIPSGADIFNLLSNNWLFLYPIKKSQ